MEAKTFRVTYVDGFKEIFIAKNMDEVVQQIENKATSKYGVSDIERIEEISAFPNTQKHRRNNNV